jgi:hypothetical protein
LADTSASDEPPAADAERDANREADAVFAKLKSMTRAESPDDED